MRVELAKGRVALKVKQIKMYKVSKVKVKKIRDHNLGLRSTRTREPLRVHEADGDNELEPHLTVGSPKPPLLTSQ